MESTLSSIVPVLKFFANTLLNKDKKKSNFMESILSSYEYCDNT